MKLVEKINANALNFQIQDLKSIETNKALELLFYSIRMAISNDTFETDEEIDDILKFQFYLSIIYKNHIGKVMIKGI
ncbi:MAG: hypothetical protein HOO91_03810 [Bacteroidales bacterium]|nr:hypothetical protein [Bacteroidales bacterium]